MPVDAAKKKQYRDADYARNKERLLAMSAVRNVLAGKAVQQKTREKYGWDTATINGIRRHEERTRLNLLHDLNLDADKLQALYEKHPPLSALRDDPVRIHVPPARDPAPFKQCLEVVPAAGTGSITWNEIQTFWSGPVEKHEMGSNRARMTMRGGKMVPEMYAEGTKRSKIKTFDMLRVHYRAEPRDNAMPVLRRAEDVMAYFKTVYAKSAEKMAADVTREGSAHAVAGRDDGEEVSSGGGARASDAPLVSKAAHNRRARHQAPELKEVTSTYANRLGDIISTYEAWGAFREALGSDALAKYRGGFGEGQTAFMAAKEAAKETARNRTKAPEYAVPHYELLLEQLPRIKAALGPTPRYLAAYLQVKLLGLRDNLGGIRVYESGEGKTFKPGDAEDMRDAWYNRETGRLYISWFKTNNTKYGEPYDFHLEGKVRDEVEESLRRHPREWLVGVGRDRKHGKPQPAGPTVQKAFDAIGFKYRTMGNTGMKWVNPGPLEIRHSQVTYEHERLERKGLTPKEIADKIGIRFNHSSDVNQDYKRVTFRTLEEGKKPARRPPAMPDIAEESGESTPAPPPEPKAKPKAKPAAAATTPIPEPAAPPRVSRSGRKIVGNPRYNN